MLCFRIILLPYLKWNRYIWLVLLIPLIQLIKQCSMSISSGCWYNIVSNLLREVHHIVYCRSQVGMQGRKSPNPKVLDSVYTCSFPVCSTSDDLLQFIQGYLSSEFGCHWYIASCVTFSLQPHGIFIEVFGIFPNTSPVGLNLVKMW